MTDYNYREGYNLKWVLKHPKATMEMLGYVPSFLSEQDPRSAKEQLYTAYSHGGGWNTFRGHTMLPNGNLSYPGDPDVELLAETHLRKETIRFYNYSWVAIIQQDGSHEIARMD